MLELVTNLDGEELGLDDYLQDFEDRFWRVSETWKLERQQTFEEPDVPSWVAWAKGDPETALAQAEEMRTGIAGHQRRLDEASITQYRARIVELPLSDYLRWELHILRIRAGLGERIRVLPPEALATMEAARHVPEILVLGDLATYQVKYDSNGVLSGAKLLDDPHVALACREEIASLWRKREELINFLNRTGTPLIAPKP
jgi:hypothetical protein